MVALVRGCHEKKLLREFCNNLSQTFSPIRSQCKLSLSLDNIRKPHDFLFW